MKNTIIKQLKMRMEDVPYYTRMSYPRKTRNGKTYRFGNVKEEFKHNPNATPQEKQLEGHFGTAIGTIYLHGSNHVVRDDGTSWTIDFSVFESIEEVNIVD